MTLPTFPTLAGQTFATKSPITATNVAEHELRAHGAHGAVSGAL